jgi:L-fuconate dehydratase
MRIVSLDVYDVRFPTSETGAGSDAVHVDPDYSLAYVVLHTDAPLSPEGHGFTFTLGRGTEVCVAAIRALAPLVVGRELVEVTSDWAAFTRHLTQESQLRWLGPDKGVMQLAAAAVLNALADLWAKAAGRPLWKLLTDLSPRELVRLVDFQYLTDYLTPAEAEELVARQTPARKARTEELAAAGYPAYTTSAGWYGYSLDEVRRRVRAARGGGWAGIKVKVGGDPAVDVARVAAVRDELGPAGVLMADANQAWDVPTAVARIQEFAPYRLRWMEEPTHPDDVLGYQAIARAVAPVPLAAGEHTANRVMFKQLLQAGALGVCQVDACRVAGIGDVLAVLLMAAKAGVPVCPHAGGVGLPELVQHLAAVDYIAVSGTLADRAVEYVEHLHEHFVDPVHVDHGRYRLPMRPGYSAELKRECLAAYRFPDGPVWEKRILRSGGDSFSP